MNDAAALAPGADHLELNLRRPQAQRVRQEVARIRRVLALLGTLDCLS
jgi:hypothetical protein